jgi:hypothetical protein
VAAKSRKILKACLNALSPADGGNDFFILSTRRARGPLANRRWPMSGCRDTLAGATVWQGEMP